MNGKKYAAEQIVAKLRQAEVLLSGGMVLGIEEIRCSVKRGGKGGEIVYTLRGNGRVI